MVISSTLALLLLAILSVFAYRMARSLRRFQVRADYTAAAEAPSVSICIPARNEMHAMAKCLDGILASDYRKLEVIVFDDDSADETSTLIRSYAHDGIRFVSGGPLPEGWLGKNYALDVLTREASGTYVIFMDVDTQIRSTTISQLVGYIMAEDAVMASVLPRRADVWRASVLFGHLRYFWQLILSRTHTPATSSSLWMINRRVLLDTIGGFSTHKREVDPEVQVAALIGPKAYRCLVSNDSLGVTYEKKWRSQVETSQRVLYPMVGGTWLRALCAGLLLLVLNVPLAIILSSVFFIIPAPFMVVACASIILFSLLYSMYIHVMWQGAWWSLGAVWPIVILQELCLFIYSLWGYARHTITWKGRLVGRPSVRSVVSDMTAK
jgi:chlorobactene glucosyltransferase